MTVAAIRFSTTCGLSLASWQFRHLACRSALLASFIVVVVVVVAIAVVLVVAVYKRSITKRTTVIQESLMGVEKAQAGEEHA